MISGYLTRIAMPLAIAGLLLAACGGAAAPSTTAAPTTAATTAAAATATPALSASAAATTTGTFVLKDDGTFSSDSKITFDLTTLASDNRNRDDFVKMDTLQTRQFPRAELVPTKTSGVVLPMPASGDFTFKLTGLMTVHGKTKEVTFDVSAKRSGNELTATATAAPAWKFADFGMAATSVPFRVVSIVDEIRVTVDLVATVKA